MTDNTGTRALCGEHGRPLFYAAGNVFCDHADAPCNLSWSDLQPEVGEKITTREGDEIFAAEVWVQTVDPRLAALASVLMANHAYSEERINDNEYGAINDTAEEVLGTPALERLSTICTSERWSPEDMAACAANPADLAALLARITR